MADKNKKCLVCGTAYSYCSTCAEYRNMPRWMSTFHSDNCRKIFNTVSSYLSKSIDATKAKEVLDTCDLTNKDSFSPNVIKVIDEVYPASRKLTETEPIVAVSEIDTIASTPTATTVVNASKKKSKSKKR